MVGERDEEEKGREGWGEKRDPPHHEIGAGERGSLMWTSCRIDDMDAAPDPRLVSSTDRPLPKSRPCAIQEVQTSENLMQRVWISERLDRRTVHRWTAGGRPAIV